MAILEGAQPIPPDLPADLERRVVLQLAPVSKEFETLRRADALFSAQSERWKGLLEKNPDLSFRPYFSTLRQNADPRLLAYLAIVCPPGVDPESIRSEVVTWPGVELAYVEPLPEPPPLNPTDDPRNANQGYLDAAPIGIDARWAWTLVDGSGMDFVDLERGWTLNHEDLSAAGITIISGLSQDFHGHGTAVLGEVGAVDNTVGCVGIAPNARIRVVSQWRTTTSYNTADAINDAAAALNPGDVLLLEAQTTFNGFTKAPVEVEPAVFTAIRAASDAGIVVVEAAGNGAIDLDDYSDLSGNSTLNRGSSHFQDSGAIMVGAGSANVPHGRLSFSNYGSRIDCYGWGESIDTTGDGWTGTSTTTYTTSFGGTSGASPIVAGSALLIQAWCKRHGLAPLTASAIRSILSDPRWNTASTNPQSDRIGVMPNLRGILEHLEWQRRLRRGLWRLAWAWIIVIGGLLITPGGTWCIRCGPQAPGYLGDPVVLILAVGLLAFGVAGLRGLLGTGQLGQRT